MISPVWHFQISPSHISISNLVHVILDAGYFLKARCSFQKTMAFFSIQLVLRTELIRSSPGKQLLAFITADTNWIFSLVANIWMGWQCLVLRFFDWNIILRSLESNFHDAHVRGKSCGHRHWLSTLLGHKASMLHKRLRHIVLISSFLGVQVLSKDCRFLCTLCGVLDKFLLLIYHFSFITVFSENALVDGLRG